MAGVWKRDGTVTVTSGSKRVIGVGTTFADPKNGVAKGHIFTQISGSAVDLYEVDYVVSNTELYLVQAFRGTTASGAAYAIITTFSDSIPEFSRKLTATLASYQEQSDVLQLLYTSDATEITVTAPDGTTHKLIPWKRVTSEGEGQAARAKVEADRAKTEADKAAQAVIDAAVPFPDVWIPFNDSLRMFAGYGREVKVGDDVVARMVNFERSTTKTYRDKSGVLRTAAINEPAFEKEGLLIEGQSTNLWPRSEGATQLLGCTNTTPITSAGWNMLRYSANSGAGASDVSVSGDGKYTVSVAFMITGVPTKFTFQTRNGTVFTSWFGIDETGNVISNPTTKFSNLTSVRFGNVVRVSATTPDLAGVTTIRFFREQVDGDTFGGIQLEALPFASSYIPTNGTAVIRGADKCWIRSGLNIPPNCGNVTIALEVVRNKGIPSDMFPRAIHVSFVQFFVADSVRLMARGGSTDQVSLPKSAPNTTELIATRIRGSEVSCFSDGAKATLTVSSPSSDSGDGNCYIGSANGINSLFGHVRNLRIWQQPLSDAQIRGLK